MPTGNCSRRTVAKFTVTRVNGRGYAVVDDQGVPVTAYSKDRSYTVLACAAKNQALDRAAKVITRPCLRCSKPFESQGIHNRLCGHCRHSSSAEGEPVGYSFGSMTGRRRA